MAYSNTREVFEMNQQYLRELKLKAERSGLKEDREAVEDFEKRWTVTL